MRLVEETIVVMTKENRPTRIERGSMSYRVIRMLEYWIVQSKWWLKDERRLYMHLITDQGMLEIFCTDGDWMLSKIWD